jgi:CDP-diacylglycerol---serine O-phosphatidyltransferase
MRVRIDAASNCWWPPLLPEIILNFGPSPPTPSRPRQIPLPRLPRLPDLLTTANLCCGVASILLASQGQLTIACGLIFLAAVFDVFDGLAARALGGGSPLGAQLDSLADMVSFGMAPAFLAAIDPSKALQAMINSHRDYLPSAWGGWHGSGDLFGDPFWMAITTAIVIAIASCWRLAKFNIDSRQTSGFLGLATPANALFWVSVVLAAWGSGVINGPMSSQLGTAVTELSRSPLAKLVTSLILGILMLSELPLPSLKLKSAKWKGNEVIYLLILSGIVLVVLYGVLAVPLILIIYLLSPLWGKLFPKATA